MTTIETVNSTGLMMTALITLNLKTTCILKWHTTLQLSLSHTHMHAHTQASGQNSLSLVVVFRCASMPHLVQLGLTLCIAVYSSVYDTHTSCRYAQMEGGGEAIHTYCTLGQTERQ